MVRGQRSVDGEGAAGRSRESAMGSDGEGAADGERAADRWRGGDGLQLGMEGMGQCVFEDRVLFAKKHRGRGGRRAVFGKCSHLPRESSDGDQMILITVSIVSTGGVVST
jgi:hypothetical protein